MLSRIRHRLRPLPQVNRAIREAALDPRCMMTQSLRRAFPRNRFGRIPFAGAAALFCAASLACSFSHSSGSFSDSSGSFSDSSKSSSSSSDSSGSDTARFRDDVTQYTEAYVEAGGSQEESFLAGLGDLARKRGVSDWESEPSTWEAIGRGLGHTDVTDAQRGAYEAAWAGGDDEKRSTMARGFAKAR